MASSGVYGTPHPFLFQGAAPDGRWLLACQAREDSNGDGRIEAAFDGHGDLVGDAMQEYLFLEPGPGMPISNVLASDPPTRRHLVLVRDGKLVLLDAWEREETVLAPRVSSGMPLQASFSEDGRRLLYVRPVERGVEAVVRDMKTGAERVLDVGAGVLGRAELDPTGHWAVFDVLERDTSGDGKLTWALEQGTLVMASCRDPVTVSASVEGDRPVRRYRRVDGGELRQGEDIVRPLGAAGLLRRAADGALVVEDASGQKKTWVPASCNARLVYADAFRGQLAVACRRGEARAPLELYGPDFRVELGWMQPANAPERPLPSVLPVRLVEVQAYNDEHPVLGATLLDLERRALQRLPYSLQHPQQGPHALLQESDGKPFREEGTPRPRLVLWNVDTGKKTVVGEPEGFAARYAGDLLFYSGWLVDLGRGRVLGRLEEQPLAIDSRGRALRLAQATAVRFGAEPAGALAPQGPARWEPVKVQEPVTRAP